MIEDIPISTNVINVNLNTGLDTVTPPILRETGSLIDCLNYEIADTMGYRRCDGFERYDGFGDGGVITYYTLSVLRSGGSVPSDILAGSIMLGRRPDDTYNVLPLAPVGIVVDVISTTATIANLVVGLYDRYNRFPFGWAVQFTTSGGTQAFTISVSPEILVAGYTAAQTAQYYDDLREYMSVQRGQVTSSPNAIAGLFYGEDRLYKTVDCVRIVVSLGDTVLPGQAFKRDNRLYRAIGAYDDGLGGRYFEAIDLGATVYASTDIQKLTSAGANDGAVIPSATPLFDDNSQYAYMVFANNPKTALESDPSNNRGDFALMMSPIATFNNGGNTTPAALENSVVQVWSSAPAFKYVTTAHDLVTQTGAWGSGTAAGYMSVDQPYAPVSPQYLEVGDQIRDASGATVLATVTAVEYPALPGTASLRVAETRYQWGKYNFYATDSRARIYGTTGASRAFWASKTNYGMIKTQDSLTLDKPKYLSMHCRAQLALGFSVGSVQLSVPGEPYNYNGVDGATESGMGDTITGMLESQGTSTIVFCAGSIARLSGVGLSLQQETISSAAGAFDYSCVAVGATPVFANQNGVGTLEQTAAYGDFVGQRATSSVSSRLLPVIVDDTSNLTAGGVVCSYACRAKDQYKLFLRTGDVYTVSFTEEGPKPMRGTYTEIEAAEDVALRVPMAWSSAVGSNGLEYIFIAWDKQAALMGDGTGPIGTLPDPRTAFRMDYGWGFDGTTFLSYFDIAHVFTGGGASTGTVDKVRMHGMGWGLATLNVTTSSLETDYDMSFMSAIQDISMPINPVLPYLEYSPVASIVDTAGWGLASKIRINNTKGWGSEEVEPPHTCQVIQLHVTTEGSIDS